LASRNSAHIRSAATAAAAITRDTVGAAIATTVKPAGAGPSGATGSAVTTDVDEEGLSRCHGESALNPLSTAAGATRAATQGTYGVDSYKNYARGHDVRLFGTCEVKCAGSRGRNCRKATSGTYAKQQKNAN
jgi:hypothetical protein